MKPGRMHRKEGPAGQRGSLFKGPDAAERPLGFIPLGEGWQARDGRDVVSDAVKAEMSRRTDWGKMLQPSHHLPPPATAVKQKAAAGKEMKEES